MLVLGRKVGDEIVIDDRIRIRVSKLRGSTVSLSIEAPVEVPIMRGEIAGKEQSATRPRTPRKTPLPVPCLPR